MGLDVNAHGRDYNPIGYFRPLSGGNVDQDNQPPRAGGPTVAQSQRNPRPDGETDEPEMEMVAAPGHGSGCGHCASQMNQFVPKEKAEQIRKAMFKEILDKVWAHEMDHASAGGHLAGSPTVRQSSDGSASGEVPITIPEINKEDPDQTISDANIIVASAMAPDDPSSQDYSVAARGNSLRSEAQSAKFELMRQQALPPPGTTQARNNDQEPNPKENDNGDAPGNRPGQPGRRQAVGVNA